MAGTAIEEPQSGLNVSRYYEKEDTLISSYLD